jgi:catechol 2,3-dioxygenase-like lactoylglutathione lyase family enzyme
VLGHDRVHLSENWIGYGPADGSYMPKLWICTPENGLAATIGNGSMVGLHAPSPAMVDRVHAAGLAAGGSNEGDPGRRPHYPSGYYLAYLRDPEGNKISAFCNTDIFPDPDQAAISARV